MITVNKFKKWMAFFLASIIPAMVTVIAYLATHNIIYCGIFFILGVLLSVILGCFLIKHPFTEVIEGGGYLVDVVDSTGIVGSFIAQRDGSYLIGNYLGKKIRTIFDRALVFYKRPPQAAIMSTTDEDIVFTMKRQDFTKNNFVQNAKPYFIYNSITNSFITKEALSKFETDTLVHHSILYLNKRTDDLYEQVAPFAKYVIEMLKPKESIWANPLVRLILLVVVLGVVGLIGWQIVSMFLGNPSTGKAVADAAVSVGNIPGAH